MSNGRFWDRFKGFINIGNDRNDNIDYREIMAGVRISELADRPLGGYVPMVLYGVGAFPVYGLPLNFFYEVAHTNDIVRTTIRALIQETFRKGIRVSPRWRYKCARCGRTYHMMPEEGRCLVCGSDEFVEPNEANRMFLEELLSDVNLNNESLQEVLMAIDFDLNVIDNAYLVVIKRYAFDDDGRVIGAVPIEILRGDPRKMRLVMDRQGRPGRDSYGRYILFCPNHRDRIVEITEEEYMNKNGVIKCPECGLQMFLAYYRSDAMDGKTIYYTEGEVLHIKKFTYGLGYGYPPLASIWMKALILLRQDLFILLGYQLMRSPRGLLIFKGVNIKSVEQLWARLMEYARQNPWMIYPVSIPTAEGTGVEFLDLSFEMRDIDFSEYRQELRRAIMAIYGITPIFHGEPGGMGRDVMMVLVVNRAVESEQRLFNDKIFPWLCRQLGVEDYCFELPPSELRDERTWNEIQLSRIEMAERLRGLGYIVEIEIDERGEIDYKIVGKKEDNIENEDMELRNSSIRMKRSRRRMTTIEGISGVPEGGEERPRTDMGEQRLEGEPGLPSERDLRL